MPNRILKESITTSVSLANLTAEEERHFYRLMVQADDYGCFQAHPAIIRASGYGLLLDKVTTEQSARWTASLARENIIHLYEANSKPYGHFVNWAKYQQIRAQRRKWPEPSCDTACNQVKSDVLGIRIQSESESSRKPPRVPLLQGDSLALADKKPKNAIKVIKQENFEIPEWLDAKTWRDFMEMRRKINAAPTLAAKHLLIAKLEHLRAAGNDPKAVLEQSIERGWKGVFELPVKESPNGVARIKIDPRRAHEEGASHGRPWKNVADPTDDNGIKTM